MVIVGLNLLNDVWMIVVSAVVLASSYPINVLSGKVVDALAVNTVAAVPATFRKGLRR